MGRKPVTQQCRRSFLGSCLTGGSVLFAQNRPRTAAAYGPSPLQPETRLLLFDSALLAEQSAVQVAPPPLKKHGVVLKPDSPGDQAGLSVAMGGSILRLTGDRHRLYYTGYTKAEPTMGICVAESADALFWTKPGLGQVRIAGKDSNRIVIEGVPENASIGQPIVLPLQDGRLRMYFWIHARQPRMLRFVAAESGDGLRWKALNVDRPCIRHPGDIAPWVWLPGPEARKAAREAGVTDSEFFRLRRIRSNDATTVYRELDGSWVMYGVWPMHNPAGSSRSVPYDNMRDFIRVIYRRHSDDGLVWSDPELIITPDERDAWDQQFYYLTEHRLERYRIGFLGHYRVAEQTMDIELADSVDGRHWHRPLRGPWLPRGPEGSPDSLMVYMPAHLLDRGDHWLALYSGTDYTHNRKRGGTGSSVLGLRIERYRFAGLSSNGELPARIRTVPLIPTGSKITVDASLTGVLRAELCDPFGRPLPGFSLAECIPVTGDSTAHALRWKDANPEEYAFDAVSLRLEWTRGIAYGICIAD